MKSSKGRHLVFVRLAAFAMVGAAYLQSATLNAGAVDLSATKFSNGINENQQYVPAQSSYPPPPDTSPQDKKYDIKVDKNGQNAHIVGFMGFGIARDFQSVLERYPNIENVVISSHGGLLSESIAIARKVELNGINTHVEKYCASSCLFVFLSGAIKSASASAMFGFHQSSNLLSEKSSEGSATEYEPGSSIMKDYYKKSNLSLSFIDKAMSHPPNSMFYSSAKELVKNGLVIMQDNKSIDVDKILELYDAEKFDEYLIQSDIWNKTFSINRSLYLISSFNAWEESLLLGRRLTKNELQRILLRVVLGYSFQISDEILEKYLKFEIDVWSRYSAKSNDRCKGFSAFTYPMGISSTDEQYDYLESILLPMISQIDVSKNLSSEQVLLADADYIRFVGEIMARNSINSVEATQGFCKEPKLYFRTLESAPIDMRVRYLRALHVRMLRRGAATF